VRFITFDTFVTGVRAFEWAFNVRTSSFVHGLMTRRFPDLAGFEAFAVFTAFLAILAIINLLQVSSRASDEPMSPLQAQRIDAATCGIIEANKHKRV
jgi:hypothetical protein